VVADCGRPAPAGFDAHAHAGTLGFEFSVGPERMIVNCGAHRGVPEWEAVQRTTAAHSTLVVEDTNSSTLLIQDGRPGGLVRRPESVTGFRDAVEGGVGLDMRHDGYVPDFGLVHRRRLFLNASGDELRGEDQLIGDGTAAFTIRFHLHPSVRAALAQDGHAVLLRLPSGEGWRFRASDGDLSVSESVYLGQQNRIRRTQQVVVGGATEGEGVAIRWSLRREYRS
jgi:uncharacterized heparinase superfamily protein